MASPVAVIANPANPKDHLLFFLNGTTQQLAMEFRPVGGQANNYTPFVNNGPSTGTIMVNQLAVVLKKNVPTVYGTSQPGGKSGPIYLSILSPYYNPISSDKSAQTDCPGVAACPSTDGSDWVYYLKQPDGQTTYQITEFLVDGVNTTSSTSWKLATASPNSNLAAFLSNDSQERFVIYANTDDGDRFLYWANSSVMIGNSIATTSGFRDGSPLAVTTVKSTDASGKHLDIHLYYMDQNRNLNRVTGQAIHSESQIEWFQSMQVAGAPKMKASTGLCATNVEGTTNYIYYITDGGTTFRRWTDPISEKWFEKPPQKC